MYGRGTDVSGYSTEGIGGHGDGRGQACPTPHKGSQLVRNGKPQVQDVDRGGE